METKFLQRGEYLFQVGDPDDSIYVVQTGIITVSIKEPVSLGLLTDVTRTYKIVHDICFL